MLHRDQKRYLELMVNRDITKAEKQLMRMTLKDGQNPDVLAQAQNNKRQKIDRLRELKAAVKSL